MGKIGAAKRPDVSRTWDLEQLSWPEVRRALRTVRVALIPTGSTEQHGPHMTLGTDTSLAQAFARRVAARFPGRVLVAPAIRVGLSSHHMRFPGSMTVRAATFIALGRDMVASLTRHGVRKFLFVNGHGGNRAALTTLCTELREDLGVEAATFTWFLLVPDLIAAHVGKQRVHACEIEASAGLALAPEIVRTDRLTKGKDRPYPYRCTHPKESWSVEYPYRWDELTANGAFGDASRATAALGAELCDTALDRLCLFVEDFIATRRSKARTSAATARERRTKR